ncbi:MAG: hypothetical protein C0190_05920 [Thermodesulfobacterium geofontis]|uniref:CBS domain-containing protein n=1 Tax=Thermodesulfobacterium geofontis TaxID=1295609 RepID=A0A2N7PMI2_9BACT|nr:MAG: hypothetical protein C0190_05920 [Thermodesulfobacterium geofontis]
MVEIYFTFAVILIFLSMFFTLSEVGIFSLSRIEVASLQNFGLSEKYLQILKRPEELLIVLIVGNEIVDYFASFCISKGFTSLFSEEGKTIAFIVFAIIGFWLGDFFPKVAGFKLKSLIISKIFYLIYLFYEIFYPIRRIYTFIYSGLEKRFPSSLFYPQTFSPAEQIILYMLDEAYKKKKITEKERKFIYGLFLSEKTPVSAILTPRSEIVAFKDQVVTLGFLERLKQLPYNKFPVYKETLDDVIGILYAKDLIKNFSLEILNAKKLSDFVRPAYFIPETFKVRDLLFEFQKAQIKIALVIDEYGILKGLVTLEDVLEELFGEIYEEREAKVEPIQRLGDKKWLVHGKTLLEELKVLLGMEILEEELQDVKTLSGFLLALFKEVPKEGDSIEYGEFKFTVKKIKGRKIFWVEIEKKNA